MRVVALAKRLAILADCDEGIGTGKVAAKHGVSGTFVRNLKKERRETGTLRGPRKRGKGRKPKIDRIRVQELVAADADATLAELRERLGVRCSLSALWSVLHDLKITFKKKTLRAAEQDRPDVAERRVAWRAWQIGLDPRRLVFIDETWTTTNMTRLRGWALRGQRLIDAVPHGHWKTTTLIAALDQGGMRCSMLLDGAVNALAFQAFVQDVLAPTLRPNDLVVLDNLSSHKPQRVADLIRAAGADLVYLPPYSPDLNPIEPAFSKIKQSLRSLAIQRVDEQWHAMQAVLDQISSSDANGFFRHCGYAAEQN